MAMFVLVVLLLGVMPALLYLVGLGAMRYTRRTPAWIGFPARKPDPKPPGRVDA